MYDLKLTTKQQNQEEGYIFPYHYLNLFSDEYRYIWDNEYLSYLEIVSGYIKKKNPKTLLDAGCGDGRLLFELKNTKIELTGIDFSSQAINFAKIYNPKAVFFVQDLARVTLMKKYDCVSLIETIEHIKPKVLDKVIDNLCKILNRDGLLIITVPTTNTPLPAKHYQHFNVEKIESLLKGKFKIEKFIGQSKSGFLKKIYYFLQIVVLGIVPIKDRVRFTERFLSYPKIYFKRYLEKSNLDRAERLIIFAKKI